MSILAKDDWRQATLGLGGNIGDPVAAMALALRRLDARDDCRVIAVSRLYRTPPWGKTDQPPFLNAAAELTTTLSPQALLKECQRIEQSLGRERHEHWGPRTIDLDLLYMPGHTSDTPELRLPHPYLLQRAFVLVPLAEIAGSVPFRGKPFAAWRDALPDRDTIKRT